MSRRRSKLETSIQNEIELAIGSEPDLLLLRNSVGEAVHYDRNSGREWHVPYGLGKGSPDLVGLLLVPSTATSFSVWFCLEVKADTGELSEEQETCHAIWRRFGALIFVVRSVDEARASLADARTKARTAIHPRSAA
jgi:hypothetical protein